VPVSFLLASPTTFSFDAALPDAKLMWYLTAALDPGLELLRQRVDDRDADAVQATGELVILV
jgi:hypothetical protein